MPKSEDDEDDKGEQLTVMEARNSPFPILRDCLICGGSTRYVHMGIDACRACAIFYKRISGRKRLPLICRAGSHKCDTTKKDNKYCCKKCRYDRINSVLAKSHNDWRTDPSMLTEDENTPSTSTGKINVIQFAPSVMKTMLAQNVIEDVKRGHSLMNMIRRTSELSTRTKISDDDGIVVDGMMVIPTTYRMMNQTTRILISSIFEFASTSFEEFKSLTYRDQSLLVRNFYPFFVTLDSAYRMNMHLPDRESMYFTSYTTYLDVDTVPQFLSDTPDSNRDDADTTRNRAQAGRMISDCYLKKEVWGMRRKMMRWNPTEDEFNAFLGLSFWSLEKIAAIGEEVHNMADKYRRILFIELDKLYREKMCIDDYATRLGEGVLFLASIQSSYSEMRSILGVFKLLDVFDDQMLMIQLHE